MSEGTARVLEGIKVIDFTQAMLGPGGTQVLADFGADVIKIERPSAGDLARWSITDDPAGNNSPVFAAMNRNKRSVTLDLTTDEGRSTARQLIQAADVVVNNFRPHVMGKLGLGYDDLAADAPQLIYAYASGYGSTGPNARKGGQDVLAQAVTGVMLRKSDPRHPVSVYATCLADYTGAMHLAQGILLALINRSATGRGQYLEVSLHDSMLAMQEQEAAMHLTRGRELNWGAVPVAGVFEASDDKFVLVGAFRRNALQDVCAAIGIDDLTEDPRFSNPDVLKENTIAVRECLQEEFRTNTRAHWLGLLEDADLLCAPVLSMPEALAGPQTEHNDMIWTADHPDPDRVQRLLANPVHLRSTPATLQRRSPELGEHTDEVLGEFGFDLDTVNALRQVGALG